MKPEQKEAIAKTSALTQEIIKSSGELSWQWKRGGITYDPVKEAVTSRGVTTSFKQWKNWWEIADSKYAVKYNSLKEALTTVNILNWFRWYKKEHPGLSLVYYNGFFGNRWRSKWIYNVSDTWRNGNRDTYLITQSFINDNLPYTFESSKNYKEFMRYIEKNLV
jgi:hypothetical protein